MSQLAEGFLVSVLCLSPTWANVMMGPTVTGTSLFPLHNFSIYPSPRFLPPAPPHLWNFLQSFFLLPFFSCAKLLPPAPSASPGTSVSLSFSPCSSLFSFGVGVSSSPTSLGDLSVYSSCSQDCLCIALGFVSPLYISSGSPLCIFCVSLSLSLSHWLATVPGWSSLHPLSPCTEHPPPGLAGVGARSGGCDQARKENLSRHDIYVGTSK